MPKAKDLEARLDRADKQVRLYQTISRMLIRPGHLAETTQAIVRLVAEFIGSDSCLLYLVSRGELVLCAAEGPNPRAVGEVRLRLDEGLTGWVARERRLLAISREAYQDPRFKFFRDLPEDTFESFLSAPIIVGDRVVGVINTQHRHAHAHSGDEMEMITTVGEQIGCLIAMAFVIPEEFANADYAELGLAGRVGAGGR